MRVARPIELNLEQKDAREQCARARSRSVRVVERARIVLPMEDMVLAAVLKLKCRLTPFVLKRRPYQAEPILLQVLEGLLILQADLGDQLGVDHDALV